MMLDPCQVNTRPQTLTPTSIAMRRTAKLALAALMALGLLGNAALAQSSAPAWPARPVRIVVPFPPGGNTDAIARFTAERLGRTFKQAFVVENRAGAGGILGTDLVAKAAPDGYTLLMATASQFVTGPFITRTPYDTTRDFIPISVIGTNAFVLTVPASLPVNNLREFIDLAKSRAGQFNYGSGGNGTVTHLSAALFVERAGLAMTHVAYKGGGPALADVLGGQIQLYSASPSEVIGHQGAGKVKLLGISGLKRNAKLPAVPAIAEMFPGHAAESWNGLLAPANTPAAIIDALSREIQQAMTEPAFLEQIDKLGLEPVRHTSPEFIDMIKRESVVWGEVIRKAGLKAE